MSQSVVVFLVALMSFAICPTGADAEMFDHGAHQKYLDGETCQTCHVDGAEGIVPEKALCLECHEAEFVGEVTFSGLKSHGLTWSQSHRFAARGGVIDCAACHQQNDCLECHQAGFADEMGFAGNAMLNVHRSDFSVSHPISARTNPQLCSSCHESQFCSDCHNAFRASDPTLLSHRRSLGDVLGNGIAHENFADSQCQTCHPGSVLPQYQWAKQHAREARRNLVTCQACHPDGDVCLKCHSANSALQVNPHPEDWGDMDDRLRRASNGRTCRKCH